MTIFKSLQPDIQVPQQTTIFDFFFDSPASPITRFPAAELAGYLDATTKERLSWADVKSAATYISTALERAHGFQPGDTLALFSRNTIWYPVAMFSAVRLGGRVSGASPAYNVEEMTYALKTAKAKFLATSPSSMDVALQAARNAGIPQDRIFLLEGALPGYTTMTALVEMGKLYKEAEQAKSWKVPRGKKNSDVCAFLSFSSGTTGLPKAVMIAHSNVIAQCLQVQQITPPSHRKVLAVLPLFHITGLVHGLHLPLLINAEVIMLPSYTLPSMLQTVVDHKIAELLLVPPILIRLVRDPIVDQYDLSHVTRFSSGAAPLSDEILHLLEKKFPGTGFKQGYGMTESCSCITAHPTTMYSYEHARAVGTLVASTEMKVLMEDGELGKVGDVGEIPARGPQIVMGYLDNPSATASTFEEDGFLHTGDQGYIDELGLVHITDRLKEMIKVNGIGIAPAELEDLLLGHPMVEDVAVLGIPDERSGEAAKAYIVAAKGVKADEQTGKDILGYVRDKKVRHKWITEVEFVQEIPKSASGKILRRILRDMNAKGKAGVVVRSAIGEGKAKL